MDTQQFKSGDTVIDVLLKPDKVTVICDDPRERGRYIVERADGIRYSVSYYELIKE